MADRCLFLRRELGERALERRVKEDGVVAETAGAPRPGGNAAFDDGRRLEQELPPIHEGQGAHETGGGVSGAFCAQCFVNQRKLVGIRCRRPAESSRLDAGRSVKTLDFQPRIFGDGQLTGGCRVIPCLVTRVLVEGPRSLCRRRQVRPRVERHDRIGDPGELLRDLTDLVAVRRRDQETWRRIVDNPRHSETFDGV